MSAELSFHHFLKLPIELRLLIWRHTLQPRYISLSTRGSGKIQKPLPRVLQVHREFRDAFLAGYPLLFDRPDYSHHRRYRMLPKHGLRFNPALDVLCFQHLWHSHLPSFSDFAFSVQKKHLASIRCIAFKADSGRVVPESDIAAVLDRCCHLETILVYGSNKAIWYRVNEPGTMPVAKSLKSMIDSFAQDFKKGFPEYKAPSIQLIDEEAIEEGRIM